MLPHSPRARRSGIHARAGLAAAVLGAALTTAAHADALFHDKADFTTGSGPYAVAIGDLNGDGHADLALVNYFSNTVSVLIGDGAGSFGAATDFPTPQDPNSVAIADLNLDGNLDLAVTCLNPNVVAVLSGNGDGSFAGHVDFGAGGGPVAVAIADLDADGKPDLTVANYYAATVSVRRGNGDGTFGPRNDFGTGYSPNSIAIADLDLDGRLDLVSANWGANTVSLLRGDGAAGFGPKSDFGAGSNPNAIAVADLDLDGRPDLAVVNASSNTVSVLRGHGDGTFAPKADFATARAPVAVAVADLDMDGKPDVVVAAAFAHAVSVLLGDGSGALAPGTDYATGAYPNSVAVGNLNAGGSPDLAVANYGASSVSVLIHRDSPPPALALALAPTQLFPPNHALATIVATVEVIGGEAPAAVRLVSVESSEPDDGLGDGDTPDDIQDAAIGEADLEFRVRSERSALGPGRTYTACYEVADALGRTAGQCASVFVPRSRKGRALLASPSLLVIQGEAATPAHAVDLASVALGTESFERLEPLRSFFTDYDRDGIEDACFEFGPTPGMAVAYACWEAAGASYLATLPSLPTAAPTPAVLPRVAAAVHPNPARTGAALTLSLPREGWVSVTVLDVVGRVIGRPANAWMPAGAHEVPLGSLKAGGLYFYRLEATGTVIGGRFLYIE